jgi:hypothetical protein
LKKSCLFTLKSVCKTILTVPLSVVFSEAAEVAIDLMLQEELDHPLCRALAWHACHLRLSELLVAGEDQVEQVAEADDGVSEIMCQNCCGFS